MNPFEKQFEATAEAFRKARIRASIAAYEEMHALHMAVFDARESGMSIRQAAKALRADKSTVSRHWKEGHRCPLPMPVWGTPEEYVAAHTAIWSHAPEELAGIRDQEVPFVWREEPGVSRSVTRVSQGTAVLHEDWES